MYEARYCVSILSKKEEKIKKARENNFDQEAMKQRKQI
jgi:hypothetical protein